MGTTGWSGRAGLPPSMIQRQARTGKSATRPVPAPIGSRFPCAAIAKSFRSSRRARPITFVVVQTVYSPVRVTEPARFQQDRHPALLSTVCTNVKHLIALCVGTALALTACASAEPAASTTNSPPEEAPVTTDTDGSIPVIVDYSPTVSDLGGFIYLLSHPGVEVGVEVIAVSLPETGEAGCDLGAKVTLGMIEMMGRSEVPVACSNEIPSALINGPESFRPATPHCWMACPLRLQRQIPARLRS